jgi:RNA polymerase sigma-70 factor (ECF subfamily)
MNVQHDSDIRRGRSHENFPMKSTATTVLERRDAALPAPRSRGSGQTSPWHGHTDGDDADLLTRLRTGDAQAFERLVRTYCPRMLTVARRLLRCENDAADAVQEAFLAAWKSLDRFEGGSTLGTWLHRIVINAALMKLRSVKRRNELSIESMLPTFHDDGHRQNVREAWTTPAEALLQRQEMREMVRDKISMLSDDYRTVIMLRDIEELDTDATAQALGITAGAVKTRLHRARMALRELLEGELV